MVLSRQLSGANVTSVLSVTSQLSVASVVKCTGPGKCSKLSVLNVASAPRKARVAIQA